MFLFLSLSLHKIPRLHVLVIIELLIEHETEIHQTWKLQSELENTFFPLDDDYFSMFECLRPSCCFPGGSSFLLAAKQNKKHFQR